MVDNAESQSRFSPNTEPITRPSEDKLGRGEFAARVCAAIARWDLRRGPLVIGVEGSWGEGKSSLMTLVESHLTQEKFLYREFHPWLFANAESMTVEFFGLLAKLVGASEWKDDKKKKALRLLKSYGPAVVDAAGSVFPGGPIAAGVVRKAADTGLDRFLKQPPLLEQRDKLQELLADATQPFAICVEDIDRLTPDEALRMAILVRLVGAFPNVVYLLPYDRRHFEKLLSIALQDDPGSTEMGKGFRERLVQLEIPLPMASAVELQRLLDFELNRAIAEARLTTSESKLDEAFRRFGEMWLFGVRRLFSTPRAITRYAGSLALVLSAVGDEVDLRDIMLVEVLRLQLPIVYERLRSDLRRYVGGGSLLEQLAGNAGELPLGKSETERKKELLAGLLKDLDETQSPVANRILAELLPQLSGGGSGTPERRDGQRLSEPEFAERYFRLGLPPDDVAGDVLLKAIKEAAAAQPAALLELLMNRDKQDAVALRMADTSIAGSEESRQVLRDALVATAPGLDVDHGQGLELSWWERLALVFGQLMLNTASDDAYWERVGQLPPLFLAYAARLSEDDGRVDAEDPAAQARRAKLRELGIVKIRHALSDPAIWAGPAPLGMYVAVLAVWDPDGVKGAVAKGIDGKPERAAALLMARIEPANPLGKKRINLAQLAKEVDLGSYAELVQKDAKTGADDKQLIADAVAGLKAQNTAPN